jgi:hypothetical protein
MKQISHDLESFRKLMLLEPDLTRVAHSFLDLSANETFMNNCSRVTDPELLQWFTQCISFVDVIRTDTPTDPDTTHRLAVAVDRPSSKLHNLMLMRLKQSDFYHGIAIHQHLPMTVCFFLDSARGLLTRCKPDNQGIDYIRFRLSACHETSPVHGPN